MATRRTGRGPAKPVFVTVLVLCLVLAAGLAGATEAPADTSGTSLSDLADAAATAAADSSQAGQEGPQLDENMSAAEMAAAFAASGQATSSRDTTRSEPLIKSLDITSRVGSKNDVRNNNFYGKLETKLTMRGSSTFTNTFEIARDDFRQQEKVVDSRSDRVIYNAGQLLPFQLTANGNYDWSEDKTVNTGGFSNLSKRTFKTASLAANRKGIQLGERFATDLKASAGLSDQKLTTRGVANDVSEEYADGNAQLKADLARGLKLITRVHGKTASGDRTKGEFQAPSASTVDSLSAFLGYDRSFGTGRISVSRGNFEDRYLDYRRDNNGQIDTLNVEDEFDKVVNEVETKDIISYEYYHEMDLGPFGFDTKLSRDTDELSYGSSLVGTKEKLKDTADFTLTFGTGNDTVAVSYGYLFRWEDQRYKNATANRGKQYNKLRKLDLYYGRTLFRDTELVLKLHSELSQDTAENQVNDNDKDSVRNDMSLTLDRAWDTGFSTDMLFSYKQVQDVSLRSTLSANNNIKDSYEISNGYKWRIADWLSLSQRFRVYIQYVDYDYSEWEGINKEDSYNKRGNLNSIVVLKPTERLELAVRHDFNKRYNATKSSTDASGSSAYFQDSRQSISKIDLAVDFEITDGVKLEAATYRTRDFKERFGNSVTETEVFKGEIWVGAMVDREWGKNGDRHLSASVKKRQAYGPAVTPASAEYWEADAWFEWEF